MCTCEPNNATEEYYTAYSDIETSTPEEWRTSTLYDEEEFAPPAFSTPRLTPRRDIPRLSPRAPSRIRRQRDLTAGVAIVRRRIDFDAASDFGITEDLEEEPREVLERLRGVAPRTAAERLRPLRQFPEAARYAQYAPRMTRITPCGKCIRI